MINFIAAFLHKKDGHSTALLIFELPASSPRTSRAYFLVLTVLYHDKIKMHVTKGSAFTLRAKDTEALDNYCQQIINSSKNEILKLRALITSAYFRSETDKIDAEIKLRIKAEFDEGNNWLERPDLLRLLANTMPMWPQDELDYLIGRLLDFTKKSELSELTTERYLRLLENYLVVCYDRKVHKQLTHFDHIDDVMEYIIDATKPVHLMIYRIAAFYMKALFLDQNNKTKEIKQELRKVGYGNIIANWPE